MHIGYACKCIAVPETRISTCIAARASEDNLKTLIAGNLAVLDRMITYNTDNEIRLFRISSDLIPFGSSPVNTLDWMDLYASQFNALGEKARAAGMRLSLHPGQYTILNSPDPGVVARAVDDLEYHCGILDAMNLSQEHKLILHIGGVYGDKAAAIERFCRSYDRLSDHIKRRLVIENDERCYNIEEVYRIGKQMGIPVVFDNLHYELNLPDQIKTEALWIQKCGETWQKADGPQKMHYAQQAEGKRPGAHSQTIDLETFLHFYEKLPSRDIDIMLEVKDKNLSALKCINCTSDHHTVKYLETEWSRYKYEVLSHSQNIYRQIRELLKDKTAYPAVEFYALIKEALNLSGNNGERLNALDHVWGHVNDMVSLREHKQYLKNVDEFRNGTLDEAVIRRQLYRLALKYNEEYLLNSYYFNSIQ